MGLDHWRPVGAAGAPEAGQPPIQGASPQVGGRTHAGMAQAPPMAQQRPRGTAGNRRDLGSYGDGPSHAQEAHTSLIHLCHIPSKGCAFGLDKREMPPGCLIAVSPLLSGSRFPHLVLIMNRVPLERARTSRYLFRHLPDKGQLSEFRLWRIRSVLRRVAVTKFLTTPLEDRIVSASQGL